MTTPAPYKARLLVGDFHLAAYAKGAETPFEVESFDTTVMTDEALTFIAGRVGATLSVEGLYDKATYSDLTSWQAAATQPVTFGVSGLALGAEVAMFDAAATTFSVGGAIGDAVPFSFAAQGSGVADLAGVSLKDLAAVTSDTTGASNDGGAASTGGGAAHLHVTAFSGFSGAVVIVEDSADDAAWATIGTFTTVAGVTSERISIAGTVRRYLRTSVDVTGSGSITHHVSVARH